MTRRPIYLSVSSNQARFPSNRHFFAAIKDLRRDPVEPDAKITASGDHEVRVHLGAPAYAYFVHLEGPHEATHFSDNYFDLAPGEERTITNTNQKKVLTPESIEVRWR